MGLKKINLSEQNLVRKKIFNGAKAMYDLISPTLGPDGMSVLIERGAGEPLLVDDGRRVAENIKLDDPIEQLAVRTMYSVTRKTDEKAGDGTTTATVLSYAIVKHIFENYLPFEGLIGGEASVSEIDKRLHKAKDEVLAELDKEVKEIKTEKDLIDVATVVSGSESLGDVIGKMYWKLGKEGHMTMQFNLLSEKIEEEYSPGMKLNAGYAERWMITDEIKKIALLKDIHVLVTHAEKEDITADKIQPIATQVQNAGKRGMVIIARKFTQDFLKSVYVTAEKGKFAVLCVRAPSMHEEQYRDVAIWTGAKYLDAKDDLGSVTLKDLGFIDEIEVSEDECTLVNGSGDKKAIKRRLEEVKSELEKQKVPQMKQQRMERVSALSGGVGVIKIGAPTDEERNWLKYKIEDAKYATKYAFKYGVVRGGGETFKKISEKLPEDNLLKAPLLMPSETLKNNAKGKFTVGKNVIDPVLVERSAIEMAVSAASKLIRIGGAIAFAPKPSIEQAFHGIIKNDEEDDM